MTQPTLISSMTSTEPPSQVNQATQVTQPTEAISSITAATAATQVVPSSSPMVFLNEFYVTFQIDSSGNMLHPMTVKRDLSGGEMYLDPSSNSAALTYEDLTVWYNAAMINVMEETADLSANTPDSYLVTFKRYLPEPATGPKQPEPVEKERMVLKNGEMLYQDPDVGDLVAKKRELDIIYRALSATITGSTTATTNMVDTAAPIISETANVPVVTAVPITSPGSLPVAAAAEVVAAAAPTDDKWPKIQGPTFKNG